MVRGRNQINAPCHGLLTDVTHWLLSMNVWGSESSHLHRSYHSRNYSYKHALGVASILYKSSLEFPPALHPPTTLY